MSIDDRIRSAFEDLAPAVSTDGVLAALEERLATPPPPPRPPRRWRRWIGGIAALAVLVALVGLVVLAIGGGADGGDERAAGRTTTSSAEPVSSSSTSSATVPPSSPAPPIDLGPVVTPVLPVPPVRPAQPTPAVPVERDDGPGAADPSTPWTSIPSTTSPSPPSSTTTTTSRPTDGPPLVLDGTLSEVEVWELNAAACPRAATVTVSVRVLDDGPVTTVVADPGAIGGKTLVLSPGSGGHYEGVLGPWPVGTVPFGLSLPVSVTVTATDAAGQVGELVVGAFLVRSVSTC